MAYGLLNIGSLLFGLIAWALPAVSIIKSGKVDHSRAIFSAASFCACAIALCMQIIYSNHLVNIGDWSALMDTWTFVTNVSIILLAVTIALNTITLFVYRKHRG